jgi:hypothetical protein
MLGGMLATEHNLAYFHRLMERVRTAIAEDRFTQFKKDYLERFSKKPKDERHSLTVMILTLASRLLGIVKAKVIGSVYGSGMVGDVINFTYNIPNTSASCSPRRDVIGLVPVSPRLIATRNAAKKPIHCSTCCSPGRRCCSSCLSSWPDGREAR